MRKYFIAYQVLSLMLIHTTTIAMDAETFAFMQSNADMFGDNDDNMKHWIEAEEEVKKRMMLEPQKFQANMGKKSSSSSLSEPSPQTPEAQLSIAGESGLPSTAFSAEDDATIINIEKKAFEILSRPLGVEDTLVIASLDSIPFKPVEHFAAEERKLELFIMESDKDSNSLRREIDELIQNHNQVTSLAGQKLANKLHRYYYGNYIIVSPLGKLKEQYFYMKERYLSGGVIAPVAKKKRAEDSPIETLSTIGCILAEKCKGVGDFNYEECIPLHSRHHQEVAFEFFNRRSKKEIILLLGSEAKITPEEERILYGKFINYLYRVNLSELIRSDVFSEFNQENLRALKNILVN